jgi:hypothetical protein
MLPGLGSEPGVFSVLLFSHSFTLPLSHSGSPVCVSLLKILRLLLRKKIFFGVTGKGNGPLDQQQWRQCLLTFFYLGVTKKIGKRK